MDTKIGWEEIEVPIEAMNCIKSGIKRYLL